MKERERGNTQTLARAHTHTTRYYRHGSVLHAAIQDDAPRTTPRGEVQRSPAAAEGLGGGRRWRGATRRGMTGRLGGGGRERKVRRWLWSGAQGRAREIESETERERLAVVGSLCKRASACACDSILPAGPMPAQECASGRGWGGERGGQGKNENSWRKGRGKRWGSGGGLGT